MITVYLISGLGLFILAAASVFLCHKLKDE